MLDEIKQTTSSMKEMNGSGQQTKAMMLTIIPIITKIKSLEDERTSQPVLPNELSLTEVFNHITAIF